jgi:macrolide transport system ATP-binding/permease protein
VLLADEPTGALDSATGRATMRALLALQSQGRSVILVTHDPEVAAHAERIIEVRDGRIVADDSNPRRRVYLPTAGGGPRPGGRRRSRSSRLSRVKEVLSMARKALVSHRLRTLLTMLGIAIGSAAVVSIMAVGEGSRRHMQRTIGAFTSNLIEFHRGAGWNDAQSTGVRSLLADDVGAVQAQSYVQAATPLTQVSLDVRHANADAQALVSAVGVGFFNVRGIGIAQGRPFRPEDLDRQSQVAVIDQEARRKLFDPNEDPLGQVIFVGNVPCTVIGVTSAASQPLYSGPGPNVLLPHTTAGVRLLGRTYFDSIVVRTVVGRDGRLAERGLTRLLTYKHGARDFFVNNMDSLARAYERTTRSVSLMLSLVAAIALMVGGVGVMNIMLVSVTERTREIGVRLAAGARRRDITRQFLAEAVAICLAGGGGGVLIAIVAARVFSLFVKDWQMVFTASSFAIAFGCALLIGLVFGLVPARKAAGLDPGDALNRG